MKKHWISILLMAILFGVFIALEVNAPRPLNWQKTFANTDKMPYGNYLLYELLPGIFPLDILVNEHSWFENPNILNGQRNVCIITENCNKMETVDQALLFNHVHKGAAVFLATESFPSSFFDSLGIASNYQTNFWRDSTKLAFNFTDLNLRNDSGYTFPKPILNHYFSRFDSTQSTILGQIDSVGVNFIKVPYGHGAFFLHTEPVFFSNFNMAYAQNNQYIQRALSYLPNRPLVWDEYYHLEHRPSSLLYVLFQSDALHAAWLLLLVGLFLFIIFFGKRLQRIIPVINPPHNHAIDFINSVAQLYFYKGNNKNLAEKRLAYFTEYLRLNYGLILGKTGKQEAAAFAKHLNLPPRLVEKLFLQIGYVRTKTKLDELALVEFNDTIEFVYARLRG